MLAAVVSGRDQVEEPWRIEGLGHSGHLERERRTADASKTLHHAHLIRAESKGGQEPGRGHFR